MIQKYTDEQKQQIKQDYLQGKSLGYLAVKFAKDKFRAESQKPRIRQILVEQGVAIRKKNERVKQLPTINGLAKKHPHKTTAKLLVEIRFMLTQVLEHCKRMEKEQHL